MGMLHYCYTMHNNTHSVHNRLLKPWWGRLPWSQKFSTSSLLPCPDSTDAHCPSGGPGPPTPKVASPLLGSAHTPFPGYGTCLSQSHTSDLLTEITSPIFTNQMLQMFLSLPPFGIAFPWLPQFPVTRFKHNLISHVTSGGQSYSYKVTPLRNQLLFKVTSNGFVTFKIAVTSNCNGTFTFKSG